MNSHFTPMSHHTVQFAKDYRAEQIRAAGQARKAVAPRTRSRWTSRTRALWTTVAARLRHRRRDAENVETVRSPRAVH